MAYLENLERYPRLFTSNFKAMAELWRLFPLEPNDCVIFDGNRDTMDADKCAIRVAESSTPSLLSFRLFSSIDLIVVADTHMRYRVTMNRTP